MKQSKLANLASTRRDFEEHNQFSSKGRKFEVGSVADDLGGFPPGIAGIAEKFESAMRKASAETDTWKCPVCANIVRASGEFHIEWGRPSCMPCINSGKGVVDLVLVRIEGTSPYQHGSSAT
jgi:hypothetical protein